ncbi:2Fe-2S ferredoxin-type domain-containing protein [Citrus sinensis]|uniref:2Fe-2S ferredoxin-type domain-containing protein n=1 Tax=Citrus sinensis TaxID=2711 RepID=A0ACB8K899_CITSI|nr:2Fe-2S ferredoxin-type domain-containing protein [Citrus sinensis]
MSMLEAVHENDIELEGACEGSLACSTCHVIKTQMLKKITWPELDGVRLAFPAATRDFVVDGYVPKLH